MKELKGQPVAGAMNEGSAERIQKLKERGIAPRLAVVRVGESPDDLAYENGIRKRFAAAGAEMETFVLPADASQDELERTIASLNEDAGTHGILLFRPLPKHLSEERIKRLIDERKDVDCMGLISLARIFAGDRDGYPPCTAQAVIEMLDFYGMDLTGRRVTVVGRSLVVGKPLAMLLLGRNATVTVCHTKTRDLAAECRRADILIACAGSPGMITSAHVHPEQIVIDVGINMVDGRLCGDVDSEDVSGKVEALSPVPGGVGSVTTSVLLKHTVTCAERA